jgi:hypothetical protein
MATNLAQRSFLLPRSLLAMFAAGLLLGWSAEARAYRPFDGTDAAVADPGETEIELQPAGAQWSREQNQLIAPAVVYNYGFLKDWEAVLESQLQTPFFPVRPDKSVRFGRLPQVHHSSGRASGSARPEHRH